MSNEKLERAKRLRDLLDLDPEYTQAELSRHCEVSTSAVAQWVKRGIFNYENATKIASYFGVRPEWVFYGTGPKRPNPFESSHSDGYVILLENRLVNDQWEDVQNAPIAFSGKSLAAYHAKPQDCRLIQVRGNQMAPGIQNGDFALFSEDETSIINGEIYVVVIDGRLVVCRLSARKDGLVVSYDNPNYPSEDYGSEADRDRIEVLGMLIALTRFV